MAKSDRLQLNYMLQQSCTDRSVIGGCQYPLTGASMPAKRNDIKGVGRQYSDCVRFFTSTGLSLALRSLL